MTSRSEASAAAETKAVTELKTRARLRRNAAKAAGQNLRLRDCLNLVAKNVGFTNWEHARRVLNGEASPGEDMGTFWYAPRCAGLLNQWFASYEQARAALTATPRRCFLLPYKRQFMVVEDDFIRELGLDPEDEGWGKVGYGVVIPRCTAAAEKLAFERMFKTAQITSK